MDLLAAGFAGFGYIFYGTKNGTFNAAEPIVDHEGNKLRFGLYWDHDARRWAYSGRESENLASMTAEDKADLLEMDDNCVIMKAIDWDDDGDMDLILSGRRIGARLCINKGTLAKPYPGRSTK